MKKHFIILSLAILSVIIFSCSNHSSDENHHKETTVNADTLSINNHPTDGLDSIVSIIVDISARDFVKNQQPPPVDFKNVKLKYIKKSSGEELYILCGQFITTDKQEIQFATIKNSDYEQWIGNSASTYCQDSKEIPYAKRDLSIWLKSKFEAIEK